MKPNQKQFHILMTFLILTACATYDDPKDYQPAGASSDTGHVCLYRIAPRSTPGAWQDWTLDGSWSGRIIPGHNYCMDTFVGRHIVRVASGKENVEFTLEKDQQVFIRFDFGESLFGIGIFPILVDRQTAREDLESIGFDIDRLTID
jgi:hypothetical protein